MHAYRSCFKGRNLKQERFIFKNEYRRFSKIRILFESPTPSTCKTASPGGYPTQHGVSQYTHTSRCPLDSTTSTEQDVSRLSLKVSVPPTNGMQAYRKMHTHAKSHKRTHRKRKEKMRSVRVSLSPGIARLCVRGNHDSPNRLTSRVGLSSWSPKKILLIIVISNILRKY
jgi:hypothetical protein